MDDLSVLSIVVLLADNVLNNGPKTTGSPSSLLTKTNASSNFMCLIIVKICFAIAVSFCEHLVEKKS